MMVRLPVDPDIGVIVALAERLHGFRVVYNNDVSIFRSGKYLIEDVFGLVRSDFINVRQSQMEWEDLGIVNSAISDGYFSVMSDFHVLTENIKSSAVWQDFSRQSTSLRSVARPV